VVRFINARQEAAGANALDNHVIRGAVNEQLIRERLSVKIDLTYFPVGPYRDSLAVIDAAVERIPLSN
jgi:hypothetical protein